jgi:hypothetical protein
MATLVKYAAMLWQFIKMIPYTPTDSETTDHAMGDALSRPTTN